MNYEQRGMSDPRAVQNAPPERRDSALTDLEIQVSRHQDLVKNLSDRLAPILGPPRPNANAQPRNEKMPDQHIRNCIEAYRQCNNHLTELMERLDI